MPLRRCKRAEQCPTLTAATHLVSPCCVHDRFWLCTDQTMMKFWQWEANMMWVAAMTFLITDLAAMLQERAQC
jgi:hypothetical protein